MPRDVAVANELVQQYIDLLEELENSDLTVTTGTTVKVNDQTIRFKDDNGLPEWLAEIMNGE